MTQRTSTEVSRWLQKQEWYESYIDNLERYRDYDSNVVNRFKNGYKYHETIMSAFSWYSTPEGYDYWYKINEQFEDWYYGNDENC